jgi:hypothetical protein
LLILVILVLESIIELSLVSGAIFGLDANQLLVGIPLAFLLNLFGTALPIMVFIYCILLPRFLKLTGSVVATVSLGGIAYAVIHFFESWTAYDSLTNGVALGDLLDVPVLRPGDDQIVPDLEDG